MWKAEMYVPDDGTGWCGNGMRFETKAEAEQYARDLYTRWSVVRQWRVVETEEVK